MRFRISIFLLLICQIGTAQIRYGNQRNSGSSLNLSYQNPREYTIAAIEVEGAEFLDKIALISISGLKVGDKIKVPGEDITQAIKKLWKQGLIGDIQILADKVEGSNIYLRIVLKERPRLSRFVFKGVSKANESELKEKIDLIRGRVMTDAIVKNAELSVKKYYYEKGFLNTQVEMAYIQDTIIRNSVTMEIRVNKGRKVKIRNINFLGNTQVSESKLKAKMKNSGERPRLKIAGATLGLMANALKPASERKQVVRRDSAGNKPKLSSAALEIIKENVKLNVFKSSKYVKDKYEEDKQSLITFYNSKGYRDAEVIADTIVNIDNNSIDINITVDAGKKYYFRDIKWVGNYIHDDETLDRILNIDKGDIYNLELVDKKLNFNPNGPDISSLYMDNGYLFFSVTPVEVQIDGDSVDVEMRIYEGAQATIRKVYVSGNDRTNDHVIMREIRTLPGQKFSRSELIRTQRELSQLGYFDPEQVAPNPQPNPADETVDIEWSLVERPSDQIELSGGWGGNFGFVGTLGLTFNNFSLRNIGKFDKWRPLPVGDGQKLSLRAQANGKRYQSYSVSFQEPWLGGKKPQSFGISYNHSVSRRFANSFDLSSPQIGAMQVTGFTLSLGRRVKWPDDYFTLSNSISFLRYTLDNFPFSSRINFSTGIANNATFNTTIARNSVDSPMYPRGGSSISLTTSLTPPYSMFNDVDYQNDPDEVRFKWVEYHKWMFDAKYYLQLVGDLVLEARAHMGFLGKYRDNTVLGPFERFQLGGDGLTGTNFLLGTDIIGLRGYENNSLRPVDQGDILSDAGTIYNKFVFELRYPVSLNPSATIYLLTFSEAGGNWNSKVGYNPNKLYKSSGVGVRIFMPAFGLLGIDWGYGYDAAPGKSERSGGQIHFSIGQTLR